jgi:DNA-binding NtrC family response regulator
MKKILMVEDDISIRETSKIALTRNGYTVIAVKDAHEALDVFNREKGDFDILFSDVLLPDNNGIDLANELSLKNPDLKILLSSGLFTPVSPTNNHKKTKFNILYKPYSLHELIKNIKIIAD